MSPQELLDQQRAEQLLRDARLALELSKAYGGPWARMRAEILEVLAVVEKARLAGVVVDTAWLLRKGYLDRLEKVVTFQTRTYLDFTARKVSAASLTSALDGQRNADELIAEVAPGDVPAPPASPAVANLQAGTPLRHLLDTLPGQVGSQAASALLEGILLGRGPREVARDIRKVAQIPLARALLIARTETLRVYRQATLERFQKASTLTGWTWIAKLDERTCPVCVALHGTVHALGEEMATHPNCRCAMAPLTEPWNTDVPETRFTPETGETWFARQSPERQRAMLGPGKFALYQAGDLKLADLVQPTVSPVWGRGVREKPLRELTQTIQAGIDLPDRVTVKAGTLKEGQTFFINGREFVVSREGTAYLTVQEVGGRPNVLRASTRVDALAKDFPEKAQRAASAAQTDVLAGPLANVFSTTPGARSSVTKAAQQSSDEFAKVLNLPDSMPKLALGTLPKSAGGEGMFRASRTMRGELVLKDIRVSANTQDMASSVTHEVGHYFDHAMFGTDGVLGKPGSEVRAGTMGDVMASIYDSDAGQRVTDMRNNPADYKIVRETTVIGTREYPIDRDYVRYTADPTERFARAFEQYIATRSGGHHPKLFEGAASSERVFRPGEMSESGFYGWYWHPDDFAPIASNMDRLFEEAGWLRNSSLKATAGSGS